MDITEIYHFLFETYGGIGVMVGAGILISLLLSVLFEVKTRRLYRNHEVDEDDEWSVFVDNLVEGEEEESLERSKKKAEG